MKKLLIIILVFLTTVSSAQFAVSFITAEQNYSDTKFYIDTEATASLNEGTIQNPWTSIDSVNEKQLGNGAIVYIAKGSTWDGTLTVPQSNITYTSYGTGDDPIIYGSDILTGWTVHSGNIYKATLTEDITQLFVDDVRVQNARIPKTGYYYVDTEVNDSSFTCTDLSGAIDYTDAVCHTRGAKWRLVATDVASSSSQTITLSEVPSYGVTDSTELTTATAFMLNNHLDFLTQAGEWYYDADTKIVYLWTAGSDSPANYTVRGSVRYSGIYGLGKDYVVVNGLEFRHQQYAGVRLRTSTGSTITKCTISDSDLYGIYGSKYRGGYVTYNDITRCNGDALFITNESYIDGTAFAPDHLDGPVSVTNNMIYDNGAFADANPQGLGLCNGIFTKSKDATIINNTVLNSAYIGIQFYGERSYVYHNYVDGYCMTLNDGAGIYSWVGQTTLGVPFTNNSAGSIVEYNVSLNANMDGTGYTQHNSTGASAFSYYFDEASKGIRLQYNTGANSSSGVFIHDGYEDTIIHNTFFNVSSGINFANASYSTDNLVEYNIVNNIESTSKVNFEDERLNPAIVKDDGNHDPEYDHNTYIDRTFTRTYNINGSYSSFETWQSSTSSDVNSEYLNRSFVVDADQEAFYFNATNAAKVFDIGDTVYYDTAGTLVEDDFTLQPFTSKILRGELTDSIMGDSVIYSLLSYSSSRRAMPFTVPEDCIIQSVSINYNGGLGDILLAVYDDNGGVPNNLLEKTAETTVLRRGGWHTIPLLSGVSVSEDDVIWLSYVAETSPGISYEAGSETRASSAQTWSSGMPATFGTADYANYSYSIYCSYIKN